MSCSTSDRVPSTHRHRPLPLAASQRSAEQEAKDSRRQQSGTRVLSDQRLRIPLQPAGIRRSKVVRGIADSICGGVGELLHPLTTR